jgi:hypothetical protein
MTEWRIRSAICTRPKSCQTSGLFETAHHKLACCGWPRVEDRSFSPSRHRKNAPYAGHVCHGNGAETSMEVEWGTAYPTWKLVKTNCDSRTPVILLQALGP